MNYYKFLLVLGLLFPLILFAQEEEKKESSKGIGIKRGKDTIPNVITKWRLLENNQPEYFLHDTLLNNFQTYNPLYKSTIQGSKAYLGNLGTAGYNLLFFNNDYSPAFIFLKPYTDYLNYAGNTIYYNTNKPFTDVFYTYNWDNSNEEMYLEFLHTQNVNPRLNFGILYKLLDSEGYYADQVTKNTSFSMFLSYIGTKYSVHTNFNHNKLQMSENGGLRSDTTDESTDKELMPVYLEEAYSTLRHRSFFVAQKYSFGSTRIIKHQEDSLLLPLMYKDSVIKDSAVIKDTLHLNHPENNRESSNKEPVENVQPERNSLMKDNDNESFNNKTGNRPDENQMQNDYAKPPMSNEQHGFNEHARNVQEHNRQGSDMKGNNTHDNMPGQNMPDHDLRDSVKQRLPETEFTPKIDIIHRFEYQGNFRLYMDDEPLDEDYIIPYYDTTNFYAPETYDSTYMRRIMNSIECQIPKEAFEKLDFGANIRLMNELYKVYNLKDMIILDNDTAFSNTSLSCFLYNHSSEKWKWQANGKYYFQGFRLGDFSLSSSIRKTFFRDSLPAYSLRVSGSLCNTSPDHFYQKYYSNTIIWNNDLSKTQELRLGLFAINHRRNFNAGFNYAAINNYLYFNTEGIPDQASNAISVISAYIEKHFSAGNFYFDTKVVYQTSSDLDKINVPDLFAYQSVVIMHTFNTKEVQNVLTLHLGAEAFYYTEYFIPAYMPMTGLFYQQNEELGGNYPYVNVFANIYIKGARIFLKIDNISSMLYNDSFYSVMRYPMNDNAFKFGVSWRFND